MIRFHKTYFLLAVFFFAVEFLIAVFVDDAIIRPYVGDFLVVILIYCVLKSFWTAPPLTVGLTVLGIAFLVEYLQSLRFIHYLGLEDNPVAVAVFGQQFSWPDIGMYIGGIVATLLVEKWRKGDNA